MARCVHIMKNMNKFCWQLRRQDIIWAKVQADVISSIMAKLEVAKNIYLQMWNFFAICLPSGNVYILALATDTLTESADFGFIPLFWRPQGPQGSQGCLEKQNHPLSLNLVVWCAKIGPKSWNFQKKTSETTRKTTKNDVFWQFFEVSGFWVQF